MAANTFSLSEFLEACIRMSEIVTAPDERMDAANRGKEAVRMPELASRYLSPFAHAKRAQDPAILSSSHSLSPPSPSAPLAYFPSLRSFILCERGPGRW